MKEELNQSITLGPRPVHQRVPYEKKKEREKVTYIGKWWCPKQDLRVLPSVQFRTVHLGSGGT